MHDKRAAADLTDFMITITPNSLVHFNLESKDSIDGFASTLTVPTDPRIAARYGAVPPSLAFYYPRENEGASSFT